MNLYEPAFNGQDHLFCQPRHGIGVLGFADTLEGLERWN